MTEKAASPRKYQIQSARMLAAEFVTSEWSAVAEAGTPFDYIKSTPLYWAHVAKTLRIGDVIHVRNDDGSYYGRLYVRGIGGNEVETAVLEFHDFSNLAPVTDDVEIDFKAEFAGPHHKWRVVRISDGVPVQTGLDSKQAALAAVAGLTKKVA